MSTPVATVADALISFILSLLRDPAAVEEFDAAPKAMLASNGLQDACAADVQAVKPIIVDNPTVIVKPVGPPPPPPANPPEDVVREIKNIVNQFATIDNRTTIVDQSTNQNIWTNGGDVTQIFDQEAVIASGDESVAAGDDATVVDSDVDVTIGDVAIGNTTNDDSFNNTGVDPDAPEEADAPAEPTADPADVADVAAIAGAAVETAVDETLDAADAAQEAVQEPVAEATASEAPAEDPLAADLTAADTYESEDAGSAVVDDAFVEEPIEEQ